MYLTFVGGHLEEVSHQAQGGSDHHEDQREGDMQWTLKSLVVDFELLLLLCDLAVAVAVPSLSLFF